MTNDEPDHLALTRALRWCSNLLCLWGLCGSAACRRAWRCKGEPRECLARYASLVPPEAREGAKAMLEGMHLDLRYDDVRDDAPEEIAAIEDWMARVERSARRRPRSPGPYGAGNDTGVEARDHAAAKLGRIEMRRRARKHPRKTRKPARRRRIVTVNDRMQRGYRYECVASVGRGFDPEFKPQLTPAQMLALGVFCGKYMTDCAREFPKSWFARAKLAPRGRDCALNFFGVDASQPLSEWRRKGWLHPDDPRGWFQWYCRYYMGRRMPHEDERQIGRWKAIRRHVRQLEKHCEPGELTCRKRQRQALLHWAYDSRKI